MGLLQIWLSTCRTPSIINVMAYHHCAVLIISFFSSSWGGGKDTALLYHSQQPRVLLVTGIYSFSAGKNVKMSQYEESW